MYIVTDNHLEHGFFSPKKTSHIEHAEDPAHRTKKRVLSLALRTMEILHLEHIHVHIYIYIYMCIYVGTIFSFLSASSSFSPKQACCIRAFLAWERVSSMLFDLCWLENPGDLYFDRTLQHFNPIASNVYPTFRVTDTHLEQTDFRNNEVLLC